jgi:hypothetical protein
MGSHGWYYSGGMGSGKWAFESRRLTATGAYWSGRARKGSSVSANAGDGGLGRHYNRSRCARSRACQRYTRPIDRL